MYHNQDEHLVFLKDKINEIKIALFKSETDFELQLPNNIIQTLNVDDDGTVWFFTTCNGCHARFMDRSFYAYLNYYKKDSGCKLQLGGKAIIVDDYSDSSFTAGSNYLEDTFTTVLVKMKIMQAEFSQNKISNDVSWTEKIKTALTSLFLSPAHRVYNFS
jgi:ligand-binding sensor domain-containing protein